MTVEDRLHSLGFSLPAPAAPFASYVPAVRTGNLIYTAGQIPTHEGKLTCTGKVGAEVELEDAQAAARVAVLNALAAIKSVAGSLETIRQIVRLTGYVNGTPEFTGQPQVINGASDLLLALFDERGRHSRVAVGVAQLPLNATVEIDLIVEVD